MGFGCLRAIEDGLKTDERRSGRERVFIFVVMSMINRKVAFEVDVIGVCRDVIWYSSLIIDPTVERKYREMI